MAANAMPIRAKVPMGGPHASQCATSPGRPPGSGTPQWSQVNPVMKGVSLQQGPQRPKSLCTIAPQPMQRGG